MKKFMDFLTEGSDASVGVWLFFVGPALLGLVGIIGFFIVMLGLSIACASGVHIQACK